MRDLFASPLGELGAMNRLVEDLERGKTPVQITGCVPSQKVHFMYEVGKSHKWRLIVAANDLAAREIYEDYVQFEPEAVFYPPKDMIFYQADMQGKLLLGQRIRAMKLICEGEGGTIITTMDGLMNVLPGLDSWKKHVISISAAQVLKLTPLRADLVRMGYEFAQSVTAPGEFSIRGSIVDIYPFTEDNPVRIDLWDEEVDSVKYFDVDSQRSISEVDSINIYPAREFVVSDAVKRMGIDRLRSEYEEAYARLKKQEMWEEATNLQKNVGSFIDELEGGVIPENILASMKYFGEEGQSLIDYMPEDTICFANEPAAMQEKATAVTIEFSESTKHRLTGGYILSGQAGLIYKSELIFGKLSKRKTVVLTGLDTRVSQIDIKNIYSVNASGVASYKENQAQLVKDLEKWHRAGYRVVLLYASRTKAKRMAEYLQVYDLDVFFNDEGNTEVLPGQTLITVGALRRGFEYTYLKFVVLTESDILGREQKKTRRKQYKGTRIGDLSDLKVGDYVVHENYGLGIYKGIERKRSEGVWRDYIRIEYGDDSSLFIPATQFEYIQKYSDKDKQNVKLNNLYGGEWKKTKTKVKAAVEKVAEELVLLYAERRQRHGYEYGEDTLWQREFEESFPYEETQDQLRVIEEVKSDMESTKIMDRLVCGDVGFGKTEVAIRAAFKAVQEGKQVVYLVPTTILAQQHYNTFTQRMKDYPIRVDLLSRFRTPAQVKNTLEDLKKGMVDIVIGTHRVLSKDVQFRDLGLLIIDEEQRFGVKHKEKIKELKTNVDVLTLTATPIPRTLHMSLIGVRDMSVIEQAPSDRLPIQTYVCEHTKELVREAISREVARGGQVYYVYNRVMDIARVTAELQEMMPDLSIAFAHGQMSERELESIMLDFVNGDIDVLVSTTIIETGLDIPNVNTIIIDDADRMGLSQLYQLRGRVGRSNRTAYAFILYRQNKVLKEDAEQRLEAIRQFTELGSGVKIALKDLEIRGAGNVMGHDQHGHMEAVGYDLYCKMLNEAVMRLTGRQKEMPKTEAFVDIDIDAFIPDTYISSESLLLDMYKRITTLENDEEYEDIVDELVDRFGDVPEPVMNLLDVALLRATATKAGALTVRADDHMGSVTFSPDASIDPDKLKALMDKYRGDLRISAGSKVVMTFTQRDKTKQTLGEMTKTFKQLIAAVMA
ncbi:MAG: transcription-repair coupling factor [Lachnospiraceae bacterium]|nr:transcription-repair coupling factor [Lachnospiraceae bacterium]